MPYLPSNTARSFTDIERSPRVDRGQRPADHARVRADGFPGAYQMDGERHGDAQPSFGVQIGESREEQYGLYVGGGFAFRVSPLPPSSPLPSSSSSSSVPLFPPLPTVIPKGSQWDRLHFPDSDALEPIWENWDFDARALSVLDERRIRTYTKGDRVKDEGDVKETPFSGEAVEAEERRGDDLGLARNLNRVLVSGDLWERLAEAVPLMRVEPAVARFLAYACFGAWVSEESGRLVIGNQTLGDIAGVEIDDEGRWIGQWTHGKAFLEWLRAEALPGLAWTKYHGGAGYSRELRSTGLSAELEAAIEIERTTPPRKRKNPVHIETGIGFGTRKQKDYQAHTRRQTMLFTQTLLSEKPAGHPSTRLMDYMNRRSPNLLRNVITTEKVEAAFVSAAEIPSESSRRQTLDAIERTAVCAYQPYKTVSNSTRVYPASAGLNGLRGSERDILLDSPQVVKLDLTKAQFAANAMLYDVEGVRALLERGELEWRRFADYIGVPYTPETKRLVKNGAYSLNFGASDNGLIGTLTGFKPWLEGKGRYTDTVVSRTQAEAFLSEPAIAEMRAAMRVAAEKIVSRGGARDAFGDWIDLDTVARSLNAQHRPHGADNAARSILAQVAQSWEFAVMLPILEMAEREEERDRPRFEIAVWLWDGVYLYVRQNAEAVVSEIQSAVNSAAARYGIPTRLELAD